VAGIGGVEKDFIHYAPHVKGLGNYGLSSLRLIVVILKLKQ
jgi:hypothetical protein